MLFPRHLFRKNVTLCTGHIYIALEFFMKACTLMFMVVNGHHGGSLSTFFLIFQKFLCLGVRRPFLGQNLPLIRNCHKVGGV